MTNWEDKFGDCEAVARTFHRLSKEIDQCIRWRFSGCEGCRFEKEGCDALEKFDVSIEWLQEEAS